MKRRPTRLGKVFLVLITLFYLASVTSQSGLLLFLVGLLAACLLLNYLEGAKLLNQVEINLPRTLRLEEGQPFSEPWQVKNKGLQPVRNLSAHAAGKVMFQLHNLLPGESRAALPPFRYEKRGVYPLAEMSLSTALPFGLIRAERPLSLRGAILVYPKIYAAPAPPASGFDAMAGGKFKGNRRSNAGAQFAGVRPWQPGDALKQVHWKSSAKGSGLMVKTYEEELSGRVAIALDCSTQADSMTVENCVRAAGSLVFAALDEGHHVEWFDLQNGINEVVPPFADGQELLDKLACYQPMTRALEAGRYHEFEAKVSRKASLVIVSTGLTEPIYPILEQWNVRHRRVTIYLPQNDHSPEIVPGTVRVLRYASAEISQPYQPSESLPA